MQKEHPIIFSTPMVKALLEGRKTMTRRVVKPHPVAEIWHDEFRGDNVEPIVYEPLIKSRPDLGPSPYSLIDNLHKCPYGQVGDGLWVREMHYAYGEWVKDGVSKTGKQKWCFVQDDKVTNFKYFDNPPDYYYTRNQGLGWYKRNSLFMPRAACRIRLEITEIKVERVQDISEEDAKAEGVNKAPLPDLGNTWHTYKQGFEYLWKSINGPESWDANPFVWAITLKIL